MNNNKRHERIYTQKTAWVHYITVHSQAEPMSRQVKNIDYYWRCVKIFAMFVFKIWVQIGVHLFVLIALIYNQIKWTNTGLRVYFVFTLFQMFISCSYSNYYNIIGNEPQSMGVPRPIKVLDTWYTCLQPITYMDSFCSNRTLVHTTHAGRRSESERI